MNPPFGSNPRFLNNQDFIDGNNAKQKLETVYIKVREIHSLLAKDYLKIKKQYVEKNSYKHMPVLDIIFSRAKISLPEVIVKQIGEFIVKLFFSRNEEEILNLAQKS